MRRRIVVGVVGVLVIASLSGLPTEPRSHEITLTADEHGHVLFPAQFQKTSLVQRVGYALSSLNGGFRAGYGRHAFVFAFSSALEGNDTNGERITNWTGSPASMESKMVAQAGRHRNVRQQKR